MLQVRIVALVLTSLLVGCDAFTRGEELPPHTSRTHRNEPVKNNRARIWPRSAQVEEGVEYVYETGHCGLTYDLDFDGSFWKAINPHPGKEPPSFFINYDQGYITLISDDEARYESSTAEVVELRRIDGPIVIGGCA